MLDPRYRMRPFTKKDLPAQTSILNRLTPDRPVTLEEVVRDDEFVHIPPMICHQYAVEEVASGQLVATGGTITPPDSIGQGSFWVGADVDPDHQGRGIGRELARVLEAKVREIGGVRLWASTRADRPREVRFLQRLGFVEKLRNWQSRLDLRAFGRRVSDRTVPNDVEFTTLAAEGATDGVVIDRVYDLAAATFGDAPRLGAYVPPTREQFVGMMLNGPGFLPEGFLLARVGTRYVGMSNLERIPSEPDTLHQLFTATRREFRGRGIATELKHRGIRFAQERGYRFLRTENDSLNAGIWSINARLGFQRERELVLGVKELETG